MANAYAELIKGKLFNAKVNTTVSYILAMGASIGTVASDSPVSYIVLTGFGVAMAIANAGSAEKLESELKAFEGEQTLEAKLGGQ